MNSQDCLTEQDLTLHYYGEQTEHGSATEHLQRCDHCTARLAALRRDLERLPTLDTRADDHAGTRMAARVSEQIRKRRSRAWLPAVGAATAATLALMLTLIQSPQTEPPASVPAGSPAMATLSIEEDMPGIDFLEDMELLQELDLLTQIEGV
ncbi:MAG: hypothetical protein P8Y73_07720 [Desulfuromonadales bacterium]|jgi:anti-sigma factor RsiW